VRTDVTLGGGSVFPEARFNKLLLFNGESQFFSGLEELNFSVLLE
jgi:hypothetical protein